MCPAGPSQAHTHSGRPGVEISGQYWAVEWEPQTCQPGPARQECDVRLLLDNLDALQVRDNTRLQSDCEGWSPHSDLGTINQ